MSNFAYRTGGGGAGLTPSQEVLLNNAIQNSEKAVANGVAPLDSNAKVPLINLPSNLKEIKIVANITARDNIAVIDRFEGLYVLVEDATSDPSVIIGWASYVLKSGLTNADWFKTSEGESIDLLLSALNTTYDNTISLLSATNVQDAIDELQNEKVDKIIGKQLSTEDYTTTEKNKLAGIQDGAEVNVQADWDQSDNTQDDYIKNKPTIPTVDTPYKQTFNDTTDWGVAVSGYYTISISATTHGKGLNPNVRIEEDTGSILNLSIEPDQVNIDKITGDVSFSVPEITDNRFPDNRFTGIVQISTSSNMSGGGGGGITDINGLTASTQNFNTGSSGTDFNIDSTGDTHVFNIPDAAFGVRGIISTGYQTIDGAKTFRNDTSSSAKGLGIYNADTTDNNQLTINFETDTTGAGSQTSFATTFFGTAVKDHNHATLTTAVSWNTYVNGIQKTVWSADENMNIYTDYAIQFNNDVNINNGFIRSGNSLNVLTGQGFNQGMNSLGGQIVVPAGIPITGTNIFGTNLAQGFIWSEDMDGGSVPFIGASAVGYVGYIAGLVAGKTMDTITMAVAGLSDQGSVAGAVVNNINMYVAGGLIGSTPATINNMRMYWIPSIAGGIATNEWGFINDSVNLDNHLEKNLSIGTAAKKPTDATTKLEIEGGDVVTDISNAVYIGLPNIDGSWRYRVDGADLVYEKRTAGVWVEKQRIIG